MNPNTSDPLVRPSSQRRSLLALGGAGLATALGTMFGATAKSKKSSKHGKNKKKCKNPCQAQVSQCTLVANLTCNNSNDPPACKEKFLPCCDLLATCQAGEMMQCIIT